MKQAFNHNGTLSNLVLDSVKAGFYVTNVDRRIVYWNQAAVEGSPS